MDSFLGTLVFLLPGLMMYFWLQSFGINPVVKHSVAEFSAISAMLWFPVSVSTLAIYNILIEYKLIWFSSKKIQMLPQLMEISNEIPFLIVYLGISLFLSFIFSSIWAKWGHEHIYLLLINFVRKWRKAAPYSLNPSVWDEAFLGNDSQIVAISKLDDKDKSLMIGEIAKVSRPFEPGRDLLLRHTVYWEKIMAEFTVDIKNVYVDTKSGIIISIYDPIEAKQAHDMYKEKFESNSLALDQ